MVRARTVSWAYLGTKDLDAAQVQQASVVAHVTATYPACLLTAGEKDSLAPQTRAFAARLAELGVPHELLWHPGVDHEFQFDLYRPEAKDVLAATLCFLRERTGA